MPSPSSRNTDQYLPYIAAAAPSPASAASSTRRVSNERRNHSVVAAHSGISTVFTLNLSRMEIEERHQREQREPHARAFRRRETARMSRQAIHSARPTFTIASR